MDLFDIVGPIMVGPSSSHTAGAVRMGYVAGKLLGEPIQKAEILLYGSFFFSCNRRRTWNKKSYCGRSAGNADR